MCAYNALMPFACVQQENEDYVFSSLNKLRLLKPPLLHSETGITNRIDVRKLF